MLVIEHNLDVIKVADYVVDLGPEGGDGGGRLIACGTPEEIAACPDSYTGQYLIRCAGITPGGPKPAAKAKPAAKPAAKAKPAVKAKSSGKTQPASKKRKQ